MPGRHVTDQQMRLFMQFRQTDAVAGAAAKAAFSTSTGHRVMRDPRLPSMRKGPRGRRRPDPLGELFDTEVVPMLEASPGLRPIGIFEEIVRRHPDLGAGIRRTLERRIRSWRADAEPVPKRRAPPEIRDGLLACRRRLSRTPWASSRAMGTHQRGDLGPVELQETVRRAGGGHAGHHAASLPRV